MKSHKKHVAEGKIIKPFKPSAPSFRPFWSVNGLTFSLHTEINKKEMLSSVRAMNATYFPNHTPKVSQGQTSTGLGGGGTKKNKKNPILCTSLNRYMQDSGNALFVGCAVARLQQPAGDR